MFLRIIFSFEEQEEIMFALTGKGVIIVGDERKEIEIGFKQGAFVPKEADY